MFRRLAAVGGAALMAALAVVVPGAPAQADDCELGGLICGRVSNFTNNHMVVGRIVGYETGNYCWFKFHATEKCDIATQPVGTTNPTGSGFRDVDGFTFTGTWFLYNGIPYERHQWVRVYDFEYILCDKIPGTVPRCYNV